MSCAPSSSLLSSPRQRRRRLLGDSSTVEQRTLTPLILVRIQVPQPISPRAFAQNSPGLRGFLPEFICAGWPFCRALPRGDSQELGKASPGAAQCVAPLTGRADMMRSAVGRSGSSDAMLRIGAGATKLQRLRRVRPSGRATASRTATRGSALPALAHPDARRGTLRELCSREMQEL